MITTLLTTAVLGLQLAPMPAKPIQRLLLKNVENVAVTIPTQKTATVAFFVATDCPIANRMAPELSRIVKKYSAKGVAFLYVYVDPHQTPEQVRKHLRDYRLGASGILDLKHEVVQAVGATVTPQAVVMGRDGSLLYRGRINDLFLEHGRSRTAPKTHDLRNALDQVLAGKKVKVPQTPTLGCSIPPLG
jgi:thiol-disulfide isomerase/thioredoxin